jgi:N-acetylglucosamine-6-phosphate deacetylase
MSLSRKCPYSRLSIDFQILPSLRPREIPNAASLLGSHAEGPYIHPSKKGAHNASLFHQPSTSPEQVYGDIATSSSTLKLVTLAPELENANLLVQKLTQNGIRVSLGHSTASYSQGLAALQAGATCLTHTLNAMAPLHHRDPGLAGLVTAAPSTTSKSPYFSIITDGNHLHPSVATMLFRANPGKCIVITDSIELAGLPDGSYPGHAQIPHNQVKQGSRVVIEGTETLIGGCAGLGECVQNLVHWSGCEVAEAVRCATENVVDFMGDDDRGKLEVGRRADFVVLGDDGEVVQTWVSGGKVWEKS